MPTGSLGALLIPTPTPTPTPTPPSPPSLPPLPKLFIWLPFLCVCCCGVCVFFGGEQAAPGLNTCTALPPVSSPLAPLCPLLPWIPCPPLPLLPWIPGGASSTAQVEGALASGAATRQVLHTLVVLGPLLTDFLYLVIPNIAKMVERQDLPVVSRRHAIDALGRFARDVQVAGAVAAGGRALVVARRCGHCTHRLCPTTL